MSDAKVRPPSIKST